MQSVSRLVPREIFRSMVSIRRQLHRYPELCWEEKETSKLIAKTLRKLGIDHRRIAGETGIIADIPGNNKKPFIALRADLDALPIQEETNLSFASTRKGVMHACGHDGHSAILLGAAELIMQEAVLPFPVRLIFQPAEENATGARTLIKAGALKDVSMIFGGHLDGRYPTGTLVVGEGPMNAASDRFRIEIQGQGGHGARPHECIDAVAVGSLMVMALQTIVSRQTDPTQAAVVTVGVFNAGTAPNIISGEAVLEGTMRAQDERVRNHVHHSIKRIAESIARSHGAKVRISIRKGTPPVINSPRMAGLAWDAAIAAVGKGRVRKLEGGNMGGEDFSFYLQHVPGGYVRFGAKKKKSKGFPAHSSRFDFDERALAVGAAFYLSVVRLAGNLHARPGNLPFPT